VGVDGGQQGARTRARALQGVLVGPAAVLVVVVFGGGG
jgi:hypothetical protein